MTLEPTVAVTTLERTLRQLLSRELRLAWGAGWLERVTTVEQRAAWQGRYEQERTRRPGASAVAPVGLEYSELYELIAIASTHWDKVAAALGKRAKILPLLEHFERVRNTANHSRELMPSERELMSGIAGEMRNKVTIHVSSQDAAGDYYPRIESASDSFGSAITVWDEVGELAGTVAEPAPRMILQVGDVVTFTCSGTDPKGRDLEWTLTRSTGGEAVIVLAASGDPVELQWHVEENDVGEAIAVSTHMSATGARFHRAHGFDYRTFFMYVVRPPNAD
ncbi:hypothetical protein ACPPVS_18855 [Cellulomonas sp. McL0617]|uniref:hypothetical protein n=1 Tax=Cellulomonas sp. McL0617 TaxID=3415675 RepID=UPI003CED8401